MQESKKNNLAHLLRKAQAGDRASLQLLCIELERYLRGFFWQRFQDNAIVDDLCQESYIRLLKNLEQIRDKMKLKSFVAKVALHVIQDHLRQKYRQKEEELEGYSKEEKQSEGTKLDIIDGSFDDCILSKVDLEAALNQLPEKSRNIIIMKSQGYNYEEISAEMGLTVSGVKMQVKRSMEQLRFTLLDVTFFFISTTILLKYFLELFN
ncbi:MAG: RNA polymerase sigma factor [bacterium]